MSSSRPIHDFVVWVSFVSLTGNNLWQKHVTFHSLMQCLKSNCNYWNCTDNSFYVSPIWATIIRRTCIAVFLSDLQTQFQDSSPPTFFWPALFYFLFIFHLPRCTLPDLPSVSSLASLRFLSCCHRTTTTTTTTCRPHGGPIKANPPTTHRYGTEGFKGPWYYSVMGTAM